jgi:hypothetical protein
MDIEKMALMRAFCREKCLRLIIMGPLTIDILVLYSQRYPFIMKMLNPDFLKSGDNLQNFRASSFD